MKLRIIHIVGVFLLLANLSSYAQRKSKKDESEKEFEKFKMFAYGVTTNTNSGLLGGFVVRHSQAVGRYKNLPAHRYLALEAVNIKHPKERVEGSLIGRLIFGKENYLFSIRPQYGREIIFFKKYGEEGIGISAIIAAGPSIGLEKPYFIKYDRGGRSGPATEAYSPTIHTDINRIQGAANIWTGIGKSKIIPGGHIKLAANIDMNTFGNNITGFEIGFTAEAFSRRPEIMAFATNQQVFTSGFVTLYFGNKK
ncbi:MAG: hypothetical protein ACK4NY_08345 [Spirosomataceae bacterium]